MFCSMIFRPMELHHVCVAARERLHVLFVCRPNNKYVRPSVCSVVKWFQYACGSRERCWRNKFIMESITTNNGMETGQKSHKWSHQFRRLSFFLVYLVRPTVEGLTQPHVASSIFLSVCQRWAYRYISILFWFAPKSHIDVEFSVRISHRWLRCCIDIISICANVLSIWNFDCGSIRYRCFDMCYVYRYLRYTFDRSVSSRSLVQKSRVCMTSRFKLNMTSVSVCEYSASAFASQRLKPNPSVTSSELLKRKHWGAANQKPAVTTQWRHK